MTARNHRTLAAAMLVLGWSSVAQADSYGLDITPDSHFVHDTWVVYGMDPVPANSTLHDGLAVRYGLDGVPHVHHPHVDHHQHLLLIETFQRLTGGYDVTPRRPSFGARR